MTLTVQFYTLLAMIGMGSIFGATLDTYQRFLKRGHRNRWIVFINDILFWMIQGLIIFYVLFLVNHGELRFYFCWHLYAGFQAYQALMKRLYLGLLEMLIRFFVLTTKFIIKLFQILIYQPVRGIILFMLALLVFIGRIFLTLVKIIWTVLLWLLKVIFKPIILIFKGLGYFVPNPVKKIVEQFWNQRQDL